MKIQVVLALIASAAAVRMASQQQASPIPELVQDPDMDDTLLDVDVKPADLVKELAKPVARATRKAMVLWLDRCSNGKDNLSWDDVKYKMSELAAEDGKKLDKKFLTAMNKFFKKVDLNKDGEVSVEELDKFMKKKNVAKLLTAW